MICACRAGSANEEWAYELFRSIQRIFIFLFLLVYSVGKDNSFSVNVPLVGDAGCAVVGINDATMRKPVLFQDILHHKVVVVGIYPDIVAMLETPFKAGIKLFPSVCRW